MAVKACEAIYIIDDDPGIRDSLHMLLVPMGLPVKTYDSADNFLQTVSEPEDYQGCLILDLNMPGTNGLKLQKWLLEKNIQLPIIFISGQVDVPTAVAAIKGGAMDFLEKPFTPDEIIDKVLRALDTNRRFQYLHIIRKRINGLTKREKEVMLLLVAGLPTKSVASRLCISPRTAEIHRHNIMVKLQAKTPADMVKMALLSELGNQANHSTIYR